MNQLVVDAQVFVHSFTDGILLEMIIIMTFQTVIERDAEVKYNIDKSSIK